MMRHIKFTNVCRRVRKIAKSDHQPFPYCLFVSLSVRPSAWNNSAFIELNILVFFANMSENSISLNLTRTTCTLHEDQYTFLIISRSIICITLSVSDKSCRENQNTHFMFNTSFPKIVPFMRKHGKIL
jgi:hypothetical protein